MSKIALLVSALVIILPQAAWADTKKCHTKSFMFQRSLGDISLFSSNAGLASKEGAEFALQDDREDDDSVVTVKAALVWLPRAFVVCPPGATPSGDGPHRGGYAFAPFLTMSGTSGAETDESDVRIGLTSQIQLTSRETLHEFSLSPYYRTDFDGEAEITGVQARWVPYNIENRVNSYIVIGDGPQFSWQVALQLDYLDVEKAGESGLTAGDEYGWIGGTLGRSVELQKFAHLSNSTVLSADISAHRDVIGHRDAALGRVAAKFFLSETGTTSIRFGYAKGRDFTTFKTVDEFSVNLTVSF